MNISRTTLYKIKNGEIEEIKLSTLVKLANTLNIELLELLCRYLETSSYKSKCRVFLQCISSAKIRHLNYSDNISISVNITFRKKWEITNMGTSTWENLVLCPITEQNENTLNLISKHSQIIVPVTHQGEKIVLTATLKTPKERGKAISNWIFIDDKTGLLADLSPLQCIVNVVEAL